MLGYQVSDASLMETFHSVRSSLRTGGIFAFDFWHGPSVINKGCAPNEIQIETSDHRMARKSFPAILAEDSCLTIKQSYSIQNKKTEEYQNFDEVHKVRYFFENQLSSFLEKSGFEVIRFEAFMGHKSLQETDWAGMAWAGPKPGQAWAGLGGGNKKEIKIKASELSSSRGMHEKKHF